jgi:hypothetical protein
VSQQLYIKGYEPVIGQTVLDLCFHLGSTLKIGHIDQISPDGRSAFEAVGSLNYYAFKNVFPVDVSALLKVLDDMGYTYSAPVCNTSAIYSCPVWRINITANPFSHIVSAPVLQISEANVAVFKRLLALETDSNGYWNLQALTDRLNEIGSGAMEAHKRVPKESSTGGVHVYDCGCDFSRLQSYMDRMEEIIAYAKDRGFSHVGFF